MSYILDIMYVTYYIMSAVLYAMAETTMSFRETSAWISLTSILAVFGFYFTVVGRALSAGPVSADTFLGEYVGAVILLVVLQIVLQIIAAVGTRIGGGDVETARDEREKLIELKANRFGYFIVLSGAVLVAGAIGYGLPGYWTANALVAAVVLGELVRFGAQLVYYRIGV
ncbi:MAG: hypothetical protein GC190_02815 [Alphaproteobacteria bacterium]|nr:hypothetical protein [Alphaproteobacteria bacterium]